jgi:hypothetical protein
MNINCKDIALGTGECAYAIYLPWKVKFDWEDELVCVSIDKCLLPEIIQLWEMGIKTTGCCCGHGNKAMAYIGVQDSYIEKMKELGYEVHFNSRRPNDEDSFTPKTKLEYGINKNNREWEVENE